VRVGAHGRADDDQLAAQRAADLQVGLLGRQQRVLALDDLDGRHVDEVADPPVDDEEGEVRPHRLGVHDHRGVEAHLVRELQCRALGLGVLGDRQREAELHHAVTRRVAVRPDDLVVREWLGHARSSSSNSVAGL
jgi:hypothetical protein